MHKIYGFLDAIVGAIKNRLTVEKFYELEDKSEQSTKVWSAYSLFAILISAGVLYSKFESDAIVENGLKAVVALTVVGYISQKFVAGCQNISENQKLNVSLEAYTDLGGLAFGTATLGAFLSVLYFVKEEAYQPAGTMFAMGLVLFMTTWLIINPKLIGLTVNKSISLAEEFITLLLLPVKVVLRSMKVMTNWLLVIGNVAIVLGMMAAFPQEGYEAAKYLAIVTSGYLAVGMAMALPLIAYFGYMLISLLTDIIRSFLTIGQIHTTLTEHITRQASPVMDDGVEALQPTEAEAATK